MKRRRRSAGALVSFALALACGVACRRSVAPAQRDQPAVVVVESDEGEEGTPVQAEREANDQPAQAQPLRVGQPLSGSLVARGRPDHDWYAIMVDRAQQIARLQLGAQGAADLRLELFTTAGQRLAAADNAGPGGTEVLPNLALEVGRYLVRVRARQRRGKGPVAPAAARAAAAAPAGAQRPSSPDGDAASYRLLFVLRDRGEQEELEPNDTIAQATELRFGEASGEAVGYCGARGDLDWYRVPPRAWPAEQLLRVAADGLDGVRFTLAWRDATGQVIAQRQARANEGADLSHLRLPPPEGGATVTVDCRSGYDVDVPYVLRLALQVAGETEVEPNDRVDQATTLADGQALGGLLADRQDSDSYRIPLTQTGTLRVELTPPPRLDLALALVDAGGQVIVVADRGGAGQAELLSEVPVAPPQALVQVRLGTEARRGDAVSRYRIRALWTPAAPPAEAGTSATPPPLGPAL